MKKNFLELALYSTFVAIFFWLLEEKIETQNDGICNLYLQFPIIPAYLASVFVVSVIQIFIIGITDMFAPEDQKIYDTSYPGRARIKDDKDLTEKGITIKKKFRFFAFSAGYALIITVLSIFIMMYTRVSGMCPIV